MGSRRRRRRSGTFAVTSASTAAATATFLAGLCMRRGSGMAFRFRGGLGANCGFSNLAESEGRLRLAQFITSFR